MAEIPEKYLDLFQKKAFAQLATLMPDGSPQVTTVWVDYDGQHVLINSVKGHVKDKNMRAAIRGVGLDILGSGESLPSFVDSRARWWRSREQGADAHIDKMAKKYIGKDTYPRRSAGEVRVLYKIEPNRAFTMG